MTDSAQKIEQAMAALPREREKLLVSYCNMLAIDLDEREQLNSHLYQFNQLLTDYSALGQFELADAILMQENPNVIQNGDAAKLLAELEKTTDHYLKFVDRYQNSDETHELLELCKDLEGLGESLADRFDIEDNLVSRFGGNGNVYGNSANA